MSAVDVLEVMDRDAELALSWNGRAKPESQQAFRESKEARAAVAELIEAAGRLERKAIEQARLTSSVFNSDVDRLRSALSRVRGAE
ncbi:hypothetical protein ATCM_02930 [Stenotrophomonas sp. ATCM1_4]|uniref:hypothetical protein n=1 Tax=Stenotrophomonas sp. ATCM1_4 TaxID=2259330 RepID=UPI0010483458|nr:hypothetical protein [Stenotrophomonas sp. ATCM1_4]TDB26689.1 hypothetical protein ATCM_02930 [Stenotrophomonas sp. ATCM1_4]